MVLKSYLQRQWTDGAKRLDCVRFIAALGTHEHLSFCQGARPRESAAEAGAVQTLRDFAGHFEN
jgi:hypothetical protein